MKKFMSYYLIPLFCVFAALIGVSAFADTVPPVPVDWVALLTQLYNAVTGHAGTAVVVMAIIQILKTAPVIGFLSKIEGVYLQLSVAILTTVGFIVDAVIKGQSWGAAAVTGLFTAGGAMLIYDGIVAIKAPAPVTPIVPVTPPTA